MQNECEDQTHWIATIALQAVWAMVLKRLKTLLPCFSENKTYPKNKA